MTEPQLIHTTYKVSRELPAMLLLPAGKPPLGGWPLVLALHGMGESCDLFAEQLQPAISVGGRAWLIPSGPLALERRREPGIGYAWYIFGGDQERLKQSTAAAAGELGGLLASVAAEHPVNPGLASVVGFSQGGYLASVLWTHIAGLRAICCIGGRLKQEWWPEVPSPDAPVFLQLHGAEDQSVPAELAAKAVEAASARGYTVEMQQFDGAGHAVTPDMLAVFCQWLDAEGL